MTTDIEKAARIGTHLLCRIQSQKLTREESTAAESHINEAVAKHDFDTLSAIDRFSMIRVSSSTVVLLITALREARQHEDVELLALDHVLSYYDVLASLNRVDGVESDSLPRRRAAASIIAFLFDQIHHVATVLTLIRRERITAPEAILNRLGETQTSQRIVEGML